MVAFVPTGPRMLETASHSPRPRGPIRRRTGRLVEALALTAVALAPLLLGAVHVPVILGLAAAGTVALLVRAAAGHDGVTLSGPALLLGAVTGLAAIGLFTGLDRPATALELARAAGLVALLVVLQTRALDSTRARERTLLVAAIACLAVALVGLGHLAAGATKLFGLLAYEHAKPPLLSTFGNPNHLAGALNAGALLLLGFAIGAERWSRRALFGAGFLVCAGGSILAASRGGFATLAAGLLFLPLVGWGANRARTRAQREEGRTRLALAALAAVAAAFLAAWFYVDVRPVTREMDALAATDLETDGKLQVARVALRALGENPLLGIGAGAFETTHPRWLDAPALATFTHVENEPLDALVSLGIPAGLLLVSAFVWLFVHAIRRAREDWFRAGAAAAAFALLLQSLVDFSLHFANGFLLVALLATRPSHRRFRVELPRPAAIGLGASLLATVIGLGLYGWPGLKSETSALQEAAADPKLSLDAFERRATAFRARHPADYLPCELAAKKALDAGSPDRALRWLGCATELHPTSGRIRALTGHALARLGRHSQALLEFRAAAERGFPTMDVVTARYGDRQAILAAAPATPGPAAHAANLLAGKSRLEDAVLVAEAAHEASGGAPDPALTPTLHHLYVRSDRLDDARALAAAWRAAAPDAARAWALEADALARLGEKDAARELFAEGLARLPGEPDLVFALARFELGEKRPQAAIAALDRLPLDAPSWQRVQRHALRAQAFRQDRDDARARDELRLALRLRPDDRWLRIALADVYLALGRVDEAEAELRPLPDEPPERNLRERANRKRAELEEQRRKAERLRFLGTDAAP